MREIPLVPSGIALVDDDDYARLTEWKWYLCVGAAIHICVSRKKRTTVYMHRLLMDAPADRFVDHIDGDRLNNQRSNLRVCTRTENARNRRKQAPPTSSVYKGAYPVKTGGWKSIIRYGGRNHYLGCFTHEIEAARAYDRAACDVFGEFACLNFPNRNRKAS